MHISPLGIEELVWCSYLQMSTAAYQRSTENILSLDDVQREMRFKVKLGEE
jgi:hypothetical protein